MSKDMLNQLYDEVMGETSSESNPSMSVVPYAAPPAGSAPYRVGPEGQVNIPDWNGLPFEQEPDMSNTTGQSTTPATTATSATPAKVAAPFFSFLQPRSAPSKVTSSKNFFAFEGEQTMKGLGMLPWGFVFESPATRRAVLAVEKQKQGKPITPTEAGHIQTAVAQIASKVNTGQSMSPGEVAVAKAVGIPSTQPVLPATPPSGIMSSITPVIVNAVRNAESNVPSTVSERVRAGSGMPAIPDNPRPLLLSGIGQWEAEVGSIASAIGSVFSATQKPAATTTPPQTVIYQQPASSSSNKTLEYVGIGVGALALVGLAFVALRR